MGGGARSSFSLSGMIIEFAMNKLELAPSKKMSADPKAISFAPVEVAQTPENKFREYLASRPKPQRFTGQQRDMVRFIFAQHNHFDAEQLIADMKQAGFR